MKPNPRNPLVRCLQRLRARLPHCGLALLLAAGAACAAASELPGCSSGVQHWLDDRAGLVTRDVSEVEEWQHPAAPAPDQAGGVHRVVYRFDAEGELREIESDDGEPRLRSIERVDGRPRRVVERAADGASRVYAFEQQTQPNRSQRLVETETLLSAAGIETLRARVYLARLPAVAGMPPAAGPGPASGRVPGGAGPAAPVAFRDACLSEWIDPRDGAHSWSLKYVEYDAAGLDLFSASADYRPGAKVAADEAAIFALLDGVIGRGGLDDSLAVSYSQTRVAPFRNASCQGTSVLAVVGSSRRELLLRIGALEGYWVVLDAGGRICMGSFAGRTTLYRYALDPQGNWITRQELLRVPSDRAGAPNEQPGEYVERRLVYR